MPYSIDPTPVLTGLRDYRLKQYMAIIKGVAIVMIIAEIIVLVYWYFNW